MSPSSQPKYQACFSYYNMSKLPPRSTGQRGRSALRNLAARTAAKAEETSSRTSTSSSSNSVNLIDRKLPSKGHGARTGTYAICKGHGGRPVVPIPDGTQTSYCMWRKKYCHTSSKWAAKRQSNKPRDLLGSEASNPERGRYMGRTLMSRRRKIVRSVQGQRYARPLLNPR